MTRTYQGTLVLLLSIFVTLSWASLVHAHKVTIFAWVEGDTVFTQSKFSGGKRVKDGLIEIFDANKTKLLEGRTDDHGEFSFPIPQHTTLTVILTAGMGHKNQWVIPADEIREPGSAASNKITISQSTPSEDRALTPTPSTAPYTTGMSQEERENLQQMFEQTLDAKLKPLSALLLDSREKGPDLRDIIGGIGYILGLVGLGAYVRYRRTGNSAEKA